MNRLSTFSGTGGKLYSPGLQNILRVRVKKDIATKGVSSSHAKNTGRNCAPRASYQRIARFSAKQITSGLPVIQKQSEITFH